MWSPADKMKLDIEKQKGAARSHNPEKQYKLIRVSTAAVYYTC